MQNAELEELAHAYRNEADRFVPEHEKERLRFLDQETTPAPKFRRRLGGMFVRLGTRIDPEAVDELRSDYDPLAQDGVAEAQLTAIR